MKKECNSIGIKEVAEQMGGSPVFEADNGKFGDERMSVWGLPNGSRVIETNGEPIFEDADHQEFYAALELIESK